jgi:hypothetical protein
VEGPVAERRFDQVSRWLTDTIENIVAVPTGCTVFPA